MKRLYVFTILFALTSMVLSFPVTAREVPDRGQIREQAIENSNTLKSASLSIESKELELDSMKHDLYPFISAQGRVGITYPGQGNDYSRMDMNSSLGLNLNQRIFQGGVFAIDKESAALETGISRVERDSLYLDVVLQSDTLYLDLLERKSKEEAAELDLKAARVRLELAEIRFEAGMISKISYLKAKADAAVGETSFLQAEKNTIIAGSRLASFLGIEGTPEIQLIDLNRYTPVIEYLAALDSASIEKLSINLIAEGIEHNPDIVKLKLYREKTDLDAERMTKQYVPVVTLSVSDTISMDSSFTISHSTSTTLSGSLTLSQWDRRTTSRQADISVRQTGLNADETIRLYIQEVRNTWYELVTASRSVLAAVTAEDYALELYTEALQRYELAVSTVSELTDAEANLKSTRLQRITSGFDFLKALSSISCSIGFEDGETVWEIIGITDIMGL